MDSFEINFRLHESFSSFLKVHHVKPSHFFLHPLCCDDDFCLPFCFFSARHLAKKQTTKWDWWKIPHSKKKSTRHCSSSLPGKSSTFVTHSGRIKALRFHHTLECGAFQVSLCRTKLLLRKPRKLYKQKTYRGEFQRAEKLYFWLRQRWVLLDYLLIPFFFFLMYFNLIADTNAFLLPKLVMNTGNVVSCSAFLLIHATPSLKPNPTSKNLSKFTQMTWI